MNNKNITYELAYTGYCDDKEVRVCKTPKQVIRMYRAIRNRHRYCFINITKCEKLKIEQFWDWQEG
jgi:hypothetical protein